MLAPILDRILHFNLGKPGQAAVKFLEDNIVLALTVFAVYALLMLYAKLIRVEYLPNRMKSFLKDHFTKDAENEELFKQWLDMRQSMPNYILVPTQNEWWVKPIAQMSGNEQMLFYNSKRKKLSEKEHFQLLLEEING